MLAMVGLGGYAVQPILNPMVTTLPIAGLELQLRDIRPVTPPISDLTMGTVLTLPVDTSVQPTTNRNLSSHQ